MLQKCDEFTRFLKEIVCALLIEFKFQQILYLSLNVGFLRWFLYIPVL